MIGFLRIVALGVFFTLWFCMDYSQALDTEFHGRVQSTFVLRDTNGFQYDVFDQAKGIQWRNELKFDVTARLEYELEPALRLDKIFLSYRGAYDAIFDVCKDRDAWQDPPGAEAINEKSAADFDLGKDDIEYENDLREAFIDIVGETEFQSVTLRLGRQIVQWGEADGFNVVNILNPYDNSVLMFFETPEELATPLWMGRLNYSRANIGPLHDIGFEVALIPDIRPQQFAPLHDTQYLDYNCNSPYAFGFKQLKERNMPGLLGVNIDMVGELVPYVREEGMDHNLFPDSPVLMGRIKELIVGGGLLPPDVASGLTNQQIVSMIPTILHGDVPGFDLPMLINNLPLTSAGLLTSLPVHVKQVVPGNTIDNMEYGVRLQAAYGSFVGNLFYFHGFQDYPSFDLSQAITTNTAWAIHPEQDMYGASFNTYLSSINAVLRGEGCMTNKMYFTDLTMVVESELMNWLYHRFDQDNPAWSGKISGDYTSSVGYRTYQSLIGLDKDLWIRWLNPNDMIGTSWQFYWRHIHEWDNDSTWRPWDKQDNYRITGFFYTDYLHGQIHPELFVMYDTEDVWMTMASVKYSRDGRLFFKISQMSFWGDPGGSPGSITPFTQPVDLTRIGELSFRVGYNW